MSSFFHNYLFHISAEIVLLDGVTCLYRFNVDLYFYVLAAVRENELVGVSLIYLCSPYLMICVRATVPFCDGVCYALLKY